MSRKTISRSQVSLREAFDRARQDVSRGSLSRWMRANYELLEREWPAGRVDWAIFMQVVQDLDLRDTRDNPPNLAAVKKLWQRLKAENSRPTPFSASLLRRRESVNSGSVATRSEQTSGESMPTPPASPEDTRPAFPVKQHSMDSVLDAIDRHTLPMPAVRKAPGKHD
ncbi:hypothetical protein [Acetobacter aceti]|uniref:Uncharacterized protein n=1 Tax=Acetobacter aceti TaxID=435 RepID=A0A6S6PQ42_ACEAC|nr:hypothetical protein [Acetobacter aceti]BCI68801.1 hypothetical protein AAJCM20276_34250 [Acetobacter aceti]